MLAAHHAPALDPAAGAPGTVRRTETVHVTRRTTTVNAGDQDGTGTVYGSRAAVDGEWRDRRDDDNRRWDGMAQGSRWAEVRADDHGRELHLGERRASVHSDDRGSEYRVEDRWAALRRDDPDDRSWFGSPRASRLAASSWRVARPLYGRPGRRAPPRFGPVPRDRARDTETAGTTETASTTGDRGHDRDRDYERGRDRGYDRDRDYDRDRERDYDRERGHDRDRDTGPRLPAPPTRLRKIARLDRVA